MTDSGSNCSVMENKDDEMETVTQGTLNVLECPVCLDYMVPPIKQCIQGHSLCGACRNLVNICPCCRSAFGNARNIALESLACVIPIPCPNTVWGCNKLLKIEERDDHKSKCCFKAIKCTDTTAKCAWTGTLDQYKEHCCLPNHFTLESGGSLTVVSLNTTYFSFTIATADELFLFKQQFVENSDMIYWAVQYIGDGDQASNYVYEVSVTSVLTRKKATFQSLCQSIFMDDKDLFMDDSSIAVNIACLTPITCSVNNEFKLQVVVAHNDLVSIFNNELS